MDGAYKGDLAGGGLIIQDGQDKFCIAMAANIHGVTNASHAEFIAFWKGVEMTKELGLSKVVFKSDCAPIS